MERWCSRWVTGGASQQRPSAVFQSSSGGGGDTAAAAGGGSSSGRSGAEPPRRAAWAAAAQPEQAARWTAKWQKTRRLLLLVTRLQACCRRRHVSRAYQRTAAARGGGGGNSSSSKQQRDVLGHHKRQALHDAVHKAYSSQLPDLLQLFESVRHIKREDDRLERFYATEEGEFNAQWAVYVKKLTTFFLKECPLDVDWVRQVNPQIQKVYYLNIKSGKVQEENPNALKVVAGKNRQWAKATRAREDRLADARRRVAALNESRLLLPALERRLSVPVFL